MTDRWRDIYDFWFGAPGTAEHGAVRDMWFNGGAALDTEITKRFSDDHARAAAGELDGWMDDQRSAVSLIVLCDQFPRNMFRGDGRAFATDDRALAAARQLVDGPMHDGLITVEKLFAYLPFEHSENLDDQNRCVALFEALEDHEQKQFWIDYAVEHQVIIEQFGRFPHRNAALGRTGTPEEEAWLAATDQRFGTTSEDEPEEGGA